ncbi:hypothetical protein ACLIT5_000001 [Citrobacter koseri]
MTTITREFTKEQLIEQARKNIDVLRGAVERIPGASDAAVIHLKLAEIALASIEAEPVCVIDQSNLDYLKSGSDADVWPASRKEMGDVLLYRSAPPAPVVPDEIPAVLRDQIIDICDGVDICDSAAQEIWNACRAAMLQGSQPVSNRDELPLDYLQGHKDGLEWAAQMAEANHPQTGDWLYDDPIELAKAIRKGPDMPESRTEIAEQDDNFYSWFGRFWIENYQQKNYTTSAKQTLGTLAEFAYRAGRDFAIQAGNSPVIQDGYALVPIIPTEGMVINGFESEPDPHFSDEKEWAEYEALSGCRKAARRAELCWAAMIKAAPQQEVK